jgi:PAS domain S-box-containing protein
MSTGLTDLGSILALRGVWADAEPSQIVNTVADALLGMLPLSFVFFRFSDLAGRPSLEMMRVADSVEGAVEIREAIHSWLGDASATSLARPTMSVGGLDLSVAASRLGLDGEIGIIVAGSQRRDFPAQTERIFLDVAANQATIGLQHAYLAEQRRAAQEADERAQQRTRELASATGALLESEHHSRLLVDTIPGLVAILTPAGEVEVINDELVEYCGQPLEAMKQWGTNGTVHTDDLPRVGQVFTQAIASGEPYDFEARIRRFDGVYHWCQVRGLPFRDPSGRILRWFVLLSDIDDRKRAENALRESERESRLIVDTIPGFIVVHTAGGELEFVNRPMFEYFGKTFEELKHWGTGGMTHPEDHARAVESFTRSIASGEPFEIELRARRFDGVYRWFRSRGLPLRDTNGDIVRWYNLLIDIDESKRAEQELRRSEARKAAILDAALECIVTIDHEGCITEFNPAAERTFGYRRDEVLGRQLADIIIPPALRERHRQGFARYLATGEARVLGQRIEMTAVRADGSEFPAELAITRIPLDGPPSFTGYMRDITERRQSEEELRRSEAFLAQAQSLTLTGSLWWDVSTGEIIWSDETFRVMEVPKSIKPTLELALNRVYPADLSLVREMVDRSAREGVNMDFETRLRMPDESVKHVHVVLHNIGQPGTPQFVGALTDITERKRAEAELRRAYDHLTEAQRLSQTGSFTSDLERDEHYWSEEFYRICEFEPGSTVTIQRLGAIVHPEDVALYEGAIGRAMAGTEPDFYFRILTSRGVVKHLRGFAHQIADRPVFVGAVQDVTTSKMAQEALNRAGAELAHVSRMTALSALTASIAHEVNQPLSGIITNAGTCLRMLDAAPPDIAGARETARRTIRDGNRASDVITRLRVLFSKREFTLEPVDLNEATREVIALASNELQRNRVILQSELGESLPTVTGDRIQLQQVILNLVRNAADALADVHDRPRHLSIKTEGENGNRVRVTVRDAGVGLTLENLDSVFNAFYTTKSGGMGIGLFVSRSIIEKHHGRLWAEPNDGPGATFAFSVPVST